LACRGQKGTVPLKLRIEVDGSAYLLDFRPSGAQFTYALEGATSASGTGSIEEIVPGVFSLLLNDRSITVSIDESTSGLEVWAGGQRHSVSLTDARDRSQTKGFSSNGPIEVRAQMPGRVVKLLVGVGATVEAGQGLLVVEAMKMQNEVKSPKSGKILRIHATEGATVTAGESLIVVE
jgi:biotin carboxyl carrier protein